MVLILLLVELAELAISYLRVSQMAAPTLEKTAAPDATKITYASYTSVTGTAGAVTSNAQVNIYDGSNLLGIGN